MTASVQPGPTPPVPVRRTSVLLDPGGDRVLGRPHVPGDDPGGPSRVERIARGVLALSEDELAAELVEVRRRFAARHRDLGLMLRRNAERAAAWTQGATEDQLALVGAFLTQEHAFESAALTNPSMVPAPDQSGAADGELRFLLSLRAIGEGHISSITFRTGTIAADGDVVVDPVGPLVETGERRPAVYERRHFAHKLRELGADVGLTARVLDQLPRHFGPAELEQAIDVLQDQPPALRHESEKLMRWLAASNYLLAFDPALTPLAERLIWPEGPFESRGMEDARFVHFTEDDGSTTYYATYTAFDGFTILPQLIETNDFVTFEISTLSGPGALNKGMALFPRTIGGSYLALSRPDRENIHLLRSSDLRAWHTPSAVLRQPQRPWESVQMGNCGSPIETERGWLVLTHGVGPMRTYRLGVLLLDLDEPDRVVADLPVPLLEADEQERSGYVPNVVYSCGALRHGDHLVLPYGASDRSTKVAVLSLPDLLDALLAHPTSER